MRQTAKMTLAAAGLALASAAANADRLSDCKQSTVGEVRIAACSEVIGTKTTPPEALAEAYRIRADAYSERAHHKEAVADYTQAIRLKADDSAAYYGRGAARLALKDVDGAIDDFTQASRYNAASAGLYVARGYAELVKGATGEAVADFTVAIRLDPKNAGAFNNRGLAYRKKGDIDNAIKDYSSAIGVNPIYAIAYNNRGYALEVEGRQEGCGRRFPPRVVARSLAGGRQERLEASGRARGAHSRDGKTDREGADCSRSATAPGATPSERPATAPTRAHRAGASSTCAIPSRRCANP